MNREKAARHPFMTAWRMKVAAIGVLRKHLGAMATARAVFRYMVLSNRDLWEGFPAAESPKEKQSRQQIQEAVVMYRALQEIVPGKALEVTRELVHVAAIEFLKGMVPALDRATIDAMDHGQREALMKETIDSFPNSTWELVDSSKTRFHFRISRCRFPELLVDLGHPELSTAFCTGDLEYFQVHQEEIELSRPGTIGAGDECCDFIFTLQPDGSP